MAIFQKIRLARVMIMSFLLIAGGYYWSHPLAKRESYSPTGTRPDYPPATRVASLEKALNEFREDCGRYPTAREGLRALLERPTEIPAEAWRGPYTLDSEVPVGGYAEAIQRARAAWGRVEVQTREMDLAEIAPDERFAMAEGK